MFSHVPNKSAALDCFLPRVSALVWELPFRHYKLFLVNCWKYKCKDRCIVRVQLADAKLFVVLGEKTRSGMKVGPHGRPCDWVFEAAMNSPEVQHLLQPMPASHTKDVGADPRDRSRPPPGGKGNKGGKGKGKSNKGKNKWGPSVPRELLTMCCVSTTNKGHALCYDYNLGKCEAQVNRQRCAKGLHLCAVRNCH